MKIFIALLTIFCCTCTLVQATEGLITKTSNYSVRETMNRFEIMVKEKGFSVVARVNHAAAAIKSGGTLRATELLIFGNPTLGTLLMQSNQSVGIDLPLKVLVSEDENGVVTLSYNDPAWLKKRHGITDREKSFTKMSGAMSTLSDAAVQ